MDGFSCCTLAAFTNASVVAACHVSVHSSNHLHGWLFLLHISSVHKCAFGECNGCCREGRVSHICLLPFKLSGLLLHHRGIAASDCSRSNYVLQRLISLRHITKFGALMLLSLFSLLF